MARRRNSFKIPGMSFSWKRALGVTSAKRKIARATGIPTTRSGRRAKAGRLMGCATYILLAFIMIFVFIFSGVALAETDQAIEFMDIPWDKSAYEYLTEVRMNLGLTPANPDIDDFSVIGDYAVVLETLDKVQYGCGYQIDIFPRKPFSVAGYPILGIAAQSVFTVQNGYVNTNPIGSKVAQVKYILKDESIANGSAAAEDLINKLTALYGKCDEVYEDEPDPEDGSVNYTYKWNGAGSFVMLFYTLNTDNSFAFVNIIYGIDNAQELIDYIRNPELTLFETFPYVEIDPENSDNL